MERAEQPGEPRPAVGPAAAARLIASRNFGPYFVGNALSASGGWFQNLAAALLVYRLTGSELLLGVLNFCQFVPVLVLAPWAGAAADRFEKRRLLVGMQLAAAALSGALAALAWAGLAEPWIVIVFALGLGSTSAFSAPASQALIGWLVSERDLPTAVGLNSMTYNLARATGPALAAVAVRTIGIPAAFAINAASYLALVAALAVVRARPQPPPLDARPRLLDSLRLVLANRRLLVFLSIVTAAGFASDPVNTLAPAFARAFGRPDTDAGFIVGAFGAGAVVAALLLAGRVTGSRRRMVAMLLLLVGGMVGFGLTPWLPLGYALLVAAGFGYLAANTHATSRLQLEVGEAHRGRIMALWSVAFLGLRPLASLADGAIAAAAGVRASAVVLVLPALGCSLWVAARGRVTRAEAARG